MSTGKDRRFLKPRGGICFVISKGSRPRCHSLRQRRFHRRCRTPKDADWPEYRKIVRRVWDHGKGLSGHDKYGPFRRDSAIETPDHRGNATVRDGGRAVLPPAGNRTDRRARDAKSKDTGKDEPLAWAYEYGKVRVFQTVLGHAAESIRGDGPATPIRRGGLPPAAS